jgi:5-methylcytosine-specific restriction endonuclease McrA
MRKKRFGGKREMILKRDGYKCVMCGMTMEEHKKIFGRELSINHIDHKGRYNKKQNNDSENLQTLCLRCHGGKDAIKHGRYSVYLANLMAKGGEKHGKTVKV